MITQTTIDNLYKKADSEIEHDAVARLARDFDNYRMSVANTKSIKSPSGYASSSERDMYQKRKFRNEDVIKTLKRFLNQVGWNKNSSAVYLYILNGPTGSVDYYHGASEDFMPFAESEWKRRTVIKVFKTGLVS